VIKLTMGIPTMKYRNHIAETMRGAFSSSLALGLVLGILMLIVGSVEGDITLDIELARWDSLWFFIGAPLLTCMLFLLLSPLSYFIHSITFRKKPMQASDDV
jgi:hypothetical protein